MLKQSLVHISLALLIACAGAATDTSEAPATDAADARAGGAAEVVSLLGAPLYRPQLSAERSELLESNLAAARVDFDADPTDEMNIVWLGRRTAYLSRYNEAITIYTEGIRQHPASFKLYRHRGHRYISLRRFEDAEADLARAAELATGTEDTVEADGIPNRLNTPLSTTQFNIWYHLGLARYLQGEYEAALAAYAECMKVSTNPDLLVATSDWMYMTLRRLGRHAEAAELLEPITADLEIVENDSYHRRLLMYKGEIEADELLDLRAVDDPDAAVDIATQGYGVANWYLADGDPEAARDLFQRIVEGTSWAAFGYIAAEADLASMPPLE